jgi:riboflavin synthase
MFTGIIEEVGRVVAISERRITVAADKVIRHVKLGDSIGVNGVCLTVTTFSQNSFVADVMEETLRRTTLKTLKHGDLVNLESALTLQKPLGGHLVQGHIDDVGEISSINRYEETTVIRIAAPPRVQRYVVEKGFIAVDGISLTVATCDENGFTVSIVNFTWDHTRLSALAVGDRVNLEADIIAKYVEQLASPKKEPLSLKYLKEHGFVD